jgi:hypothetical protein
VRRTQNHEHKARQRRARYLLAATLACAACLPATTQATQSVKLTATLTPDRLNQGTTIGFGFQITTPAGNVPSPLTAITVRYPGNLGIALSGLGLVVCHRASLEASGPTGCPADSRMGYGTALAEVPLGPEIIHETAQVTIFRGPEQDGHLALLFYAIGASPVDAQIVFPGLLLPASAPFGGRIGVNIPLVPSLPEAPDVAVVKFSSTLGPRHITYYEHHDGKTISYHPTGLILPNTCPRPGFPFAAEFTFQDGSHAKAHTTVPCPSTTRHR